MDLQMDTVNLGEYVKNDPNVALAEPPKIMYECEKLPFAVQAYPELGLGFFAITQNSNGATLPLFGYYNLNEADSKCIVTIDHGYALRVKRQREEMEQWSVRSRGFGAPMMPPPMWGAGGGTVSVEGYPSEVSEMVRSSVMKGTEVVHSSAGIEQSKIKLTHYTSSFHGILPEDTKEKIEQAKPVLTDISIVAEAHDWAVTEEVITIDPLVIGRVGKRWFLIDHFDTTGAEDYIVAKYEIDK